MMEFREKSWMSSSKIFKRTFICKTYVSAGILGDTLAITTSATSAVDAWGTFRKKNSWRNDERRQFVVEFWEELLLLEKNMRWNARKFSEQFVKKLLELCLLLNLKKFLVAIYPLCVFAAVDFSAIYDSVQRVPAIFQKTMGCINRLNWLTTSHAVLRDSHMM